MPAVIPRGGFEQRLVGLREQRLALDARIEEIEHWIALLDSLEAEAAEPSGETAPASTKRTAKKAAG